MNLSIWKVSTLTTFALMSLAPMTRAKSKASHGDASYWVYIGTYTDRDSKGIYVYRFNSGRLHPIGSLAAEIVSPSFLAVDPSHRFLYAVNETDTFQGQPTGGVSAFAIDRKTGRLKLLNQVSSGGAGPCFVSLDRSGKCVLVANYSSGSVAVFPVLPGGRLGKPSAFVQHEGHSVNAERQERPHAHDISVSPDNRFALAADLGLDKLLVYRFDAAEGSLAPNDPPSASVDPGSGPRHFVFDPGGHFVYLLNEIKSTVTTFSYNAEQGTLHELQTVPALPAGFTGENTAAEIALGRSGKFLYASNRGQDAIAVFAIDARHTLKSVGHVPTLGKEPRNFAIDPTGAYLLAANQNSSNIVVFHVSPATGRLTPTGQVVEVPSPVCIVFVPAE